MFDDFLRRASERSAAERAMETRWLYNAGSFFVTIHAQWHSQAPEGHGQPLQLSEEDKRFAERRVQEVIEERTLLQNDFAAWLEALSAGTLSDEVGVFTEEREWISFPSKLGGHWWLRWEPCPADEYGVPSSAFTQRTPVFDMHIVVCGRSPAPLDRWADN